MTNGNGYVTLDQLVDETLSARSELRIFPLVRTTPACWALMPEVLERVEKFCRDYDTDTKAPELAQAILEHFVAAQDRSAVRVIVATRGDELVGHLIVSLDTWCGKIIATIVQYEMDEAFPIQMLRDTLDQIAWWARGRGASVLRVLAIHNDQRGYARARLFRSLYGFEPRRVMLDKAL